MERLAGLISANYSNDKFGKLVAHRPLAAVPFGSRYRLIDFPLSNMVNSGIASVGLITPHLYRSIMDHVGSGKDFGLSRKSGGLHILPGSTYGYDANKGHFSIKDCKGNMNFFLRTNFDRLVMASCSKIFNIDYREVEKYHNDKEANITFVYKKNVEGNVGEYAIDFDAKGKVKGIRRLRTKANKINLLLDSLIIDKKVIMKLIEWYKENSYMDVVDAIGENISRLSVAAYEFKGYSRSINDVIDYLDASKELLSGKVIKELFMNGRMIHTKVHDAPPVKYFETAKVKNTLVGTGSIIKGEIQNSIVFRDAIVEEGAKIKNSVIMQKCHIKKNAIIENVICEKSVVISEGEVHKGTSTKPAIISND